MTYFATPYHTTIGSNWVTKKIDTAIKEAMIRDLIAANHLDLITSLKISPVFVTGRWDSEQQIPLFAHPILVENQRNTYLYTDVRPVVRYDAMGEMVVRNSTDYQYLIERTILSLSWLLDDPMDLNRSMGFAGLVYAYWISDTVNRHYALNPKEQIELTLLAFAYYQTLFDKSDRYQTVDDSIREDWTTKILKWIKLPASLVLDTYDRVQHFDALPSFCEQVRSVIENPRLKDFVPGMVITVVGQSWFGLNAKELTAVALEHPPTWISLVATALSQKTYRHAAISKTAEKTGKSHQGQEFLQQYQDYCRAFRVPTRNISLASLEQTTFE